jgi:CRP-like cAMP-binding protein
MISPETLRRYPQFAGVSDSCLKAVAGISQTRTFKKDERIFTQSGELRADARLYEKGEEATHLMLLTKGQVDIVFSLPSDKEVIVDTLVAGDLMAISALIPPYHLTASGIAREDGELIQIEAVGLRKWCEEEPELGYRLMLSVAKAAMSRLSQARVQIAAQG